MRGDSGMSHLMGAQLGWAIGWALSVDFSTARPLSDLAPSKSPFFSAPPCQLPSTRVSWARRNTSCSVSWRVKAMSIESVFSLPKQHVLVEEKSQNFESMRRPALFYPVTLHSFEGVFRARTVTPQHLSLSLPLPRQLARGMPRRLSVERTEVPELMPPSRCTGKKIRHDVRNQSAGRESDGWRRKWTVSHLQYCRLGGPAIANHLIRHDAHDRVSRGRVASDKIIQSPRTSQDTAYRL